MGHFGDKSLIDQFEDNLTGKGKRKSVDTIGSLD